MRRPRFPYEHDFQLDANARSNQVGSDGELELEDIPYFLKRLHDHVGVKNDPFDTTSHEARLAALEIDSVVDTGTGEEIWIDNGN